MIKNIFRLALLAAVVLTAAVSPVGAAAQSRIDKIVESLEKRSDTNVTFTEKRSEKKKKLYKVSRIITFSNQDYVPRVRAAFEAERDKAVSAVKTGNSMVFKFADKQGTSSYVFTWADGEYTLVQTWESKTVKPTSAVDNPSCDDARLAEFAARQAEFAVRQAEFAARQREFAARQAEMAARQREMAAYRCR